MRGTDKVKALCLGADAVAVGRLFGRALASGESVVVRVLELLEAEISLACGLLGVRNPAELGPSLVCHAPPVTPAHALSAFPLLLEGY